MQTIQVHTPVEEAVIVSVRTGHRLHRQPTMFRRKSRRWLEARRNAVNRRFIVARMSILLSLLLPLTITHPCRFFAWFMRPTRAVFLLGSCAPSPSPQPPPRIGAGQDKDMTDRINQKMDQAEIMACFPQIYCIAVHSAKASHHNRSSSNGSQPRHAESCASREGRSQMSPPCMAQNGLNA